MNPQTKVETVPAIHPDTQMGPVALRVASLERSADFYENVLGFRPVAHAPGTAARPGLRPDAGRPVAQKEGTLVLGSEDGNPLLTLLERPGAPPMPRRASGLYHFAILLPTRADLGRALRRLADAGIEIGSADHLVSEALYISDLDGNGIEIYRDRPRAGWQWNGSTVRMAPDPLDLQGRLAEAAREPKPGTGLPAGTRVGHVHLQVSDISLALAFYQGLLGFELTAQMQGAAFISAGKYHHHLGLNTWQSRGAPPAPDGTAGLHSLVIEVPNTAEQARLAKRLTDAGLTVTQHDADVSVRDPWNNEVVLSVSTYGR